MIPIQLTIQGLYSYQKNQTIDFTKLTAANLFGIFGSVGSGKSSILEAITFALYGKTDRLNLSGDNRNYNMMNLKSNELLIDFIFETGKTQTAYRTVVKGKRNSKRFDDVKALERSAYQKTDGNWSPIETHALENAIGLSYENFKRTIIIPQGQFQEFLQLGNKDRTQMLKELFNLGKFELYYKVTSLESKNNEQKQHIQGQLQQLGEIDPEQIKTYNKQLEQLNTELAEWNEKLKNVQIRETNWKQLKELAEKLNAAKTTLQNLQKQEPDFIKLENKINQYEKCVLLFKNLLDAREISTNKVAEKTKQIETGGLKLAQEEAEITLNETTLNHIKNAYETRETLKQRAEELAKLVKIFILKKSIESEHERLKKGDEVVIETTKTIENLTTEKQKLSDQIKVLKAELPDLMVLSKIKTWHIEKQNIVKQTAEINLEKNKQELEYNKLEDDFKDLLETRLFNELTDKKHFNETILFSQSKIELLKSTIKKLDSEADHLRVKVQLEKYATGLSEGEPCPLCGSTHHPEIYSADNIHEEQAKIESQKSGLEKQIEQWNETILELKDLNSQLKFKSEVLNDLEKKSEENKKRDASHQSLFNWPEYADINKVERTFSSAENLQKEIKPKEIRLENLGVELEKAIKNKEIYQNALEKIQTQITINRTETKTLLEQLKMVLVEDYDNRKETEIEAERNSLLQQFSTLEKQFNEISAKLTELRKSKDILSGVLSASREALKLEKENLLNLNKQLENQLKKTDFTNIDEIQNVISQTIDLDYNKRKLSDFKQNYSLAKSRCNELNTEMGDRVYDFEAHQKLIVEIGNIKETITQKNQETGKVKELLKALQQKLISQAELRKMLDNLELRAENIKTLKSLFKGSGFVNYISSVYLQNLCNTANDRFFKLTRQKLSLEITEDNNFQVRDFMNGGKARNVKTLSGGQTFQAALSLALALADNIQKITESNQNFFFLDEGFGSLDKESLSVVFDTLKSLQKENRIVGVISHVEEMQQEIDVHLRIENNDDSGSLICESWVQ